MVTGKYISLWRKYLPVIRILLKKSSDKNVSIKLDKLEFVSAGDRDLSGYTFNLEIQNGSVINDISGSAVARDLIIVLNEDPIIKELFKGRKIKISLGKAFVLKFLCRSL